MFQNESHEDQHADQVGNDLSAPEENAEHMAPCGGDTAEECSVSASSSPDNQPSRPTMVDKATQVHRRAKRWSKGTFTIIIGISL